MKKLIGAASVVIFTGSIFFGCAYAGVGVAGDKAIVPRNDSFLYGMLRKIYVCKITDQGLTECVAGEAES